ncbi:MAG TPA: type II toxin-antitoxin system VapC family toxin [Alloacidobacterium sp.]|nr:type II toxin-antitoxin system VapC family toxin [Alloacidobacterium sp.]
MIVDATALIAILRDEPDALKYAKALASAARNRISAVNFVEAAVVIDGSRNAIASRRFDDLVREARVSVEPVTEEQARIAREAYRDFGKESGHTARLNFGDCFAYALAKAANEPLLFKGEDFTHTDVASVL